METKETIRTKKAVTLGVIMGEEHLPDAAAKGIFPSFNEGNKYK